MLFLSTFYIDNLCNYIIYQPVQCAARVNKSAESTSPSPSISPGILISKRVISPIILTLWVPELWVKYMEIWVVFQVNIHATRVLLTKTLKAPSNNSFGIVLGYVWACMYHVRIKLIRDYELYSFWLFCLV